MWPLYEGNPDDKSFPLFYAHCAVSPLVYQEDDPLEAKKFVQEIVREGREDDFWDYIRRKDGSSDGFGENEFYLGIVTAILKMIREIKAERPVQA